MAESTISQLTYPEYVKLAYHKGGAATLPSAIKIYLNMRNQLRSIIKNCGIKTLPLYLFTVVVVKFALALLQCFSPRKSKQAEGRTRVTQYFKALSWNLFKLRDTIKKRIRIQKMRKISDKDLSLYNFILSIPYLAIDRSLLP